MCSVIWVFWITFQFLSSGFTSAEDEVFLKMAGFMASGEGQRVPTFLRYLVSFMDAVFLSKEAVRRPPKETDPGDPLKTFLWRKCLFFKIISKQSAVVWHLYFVIWN